jgi:hypothetical protein
VPAVELYHGLGPCWLVAAATASSRSQHEPLEPQLAVYSREDDDPSGPQMTDKKRYGDPRKNQPRDTSKREFSGGSLVFIFVAWIVFFAVWLAVGSLLVAAIVFGVLLSGGIAVINRR